MLLDVLMEHLFLYEHQLTKLKALIQIDMTCHQLHYKEYMITKKKCIDVFTEIPGKIHNVRVFVLSDLSKDLSITIHV